MLSPELQGPTLPGLQWGWPGRLLMPIGNPEPRSRPAFSQLVPCSSPWSLLQAEAALDQIFTLNLGFLF